VVDLGWPAIAGAVAYRVQVLAPGDAQGLLLDRRVDAPRVAFDSPQDGEYRLRVRAIDERGLEGLNAEQVLSVDARPVPPRLLGPPDQAALLATQPPQLWWSRPEGVVRFHVQVARDADFATLLLDLPGAEGTRHAMEGALEPGMHYWRAASVTGDGDQGPFGDPSTFRAQAVPDAATASSALEQGRLRISWDPLANAARYEFQLARDEGFTDLVVDESLPGLSYALADPEPGSYWFRARGVSAEGVPGPYSPVNAMEVPGEPLSPAWLLLLAPLLLLL
jgi:hypothetical protein